MLETYLALAIALDRGLLTAPDAADTAWAVRSRDATMFGPGHGMAGAALDSLLDAFERYDPACVQDTPFDLTEATLRAMLPALIRDLVPLCPGPVPDEARIAAVLAETRAVGYHGRLMGDDA